MSLLIKEDGIFSITETRCQETISVEAQIINILGFVSHAVFITTGTW